MADIKVTLRLSYATGQEEVHSVQVVSAQERKVPAEAVAPPPYRFPVLTAPTEPALIQSPGFVRVE